MAKKLELKLSDEERQALQSMRDRHEKAYLRERAAALLKVADGQAARQVAEHGLLKRHEPETVGEWVRRYRAKGIEGLSIQSGRGRKPKYFPPEHRSSEG